MKQPLISIIVPSYNAENFMNGCLTSIQNQTYKNWECICVNDFSSDNTRLIIQSFIKQDSRFKLIENKKNEGLAETRNNGLKNTKGDYISFIDADDYIHPQMIETLYNSITKENADIAECKFERTKKLYSQTTFDNIKNPEVITFTNPLKAFLNKKIQTSVCTKLFKKSALKNTEFLNVRAYEDVPFIVMVLNNTKKIVLINQNLYFYYINPISIMESNFNKDKLNCYFIIIEAIYTYIKKHNPKILNEVIAKVLNQRFKMMINRATKKQNDKDAGKELFSIIKTKITDFYKNGIISFKGLKLKHKITLYLLLHFDSNIAYFFNRIFK